MAVMARESWTDERLSDFKESVEQRFDQVDSRFDRVEGDIRELRAEMKRGFEQVDKRFDSIDKRFDSIDGKFVALDSKFDGKFDSLQRTMIIGFVTLFASIAASVIGALVLS
jgi:hypothetical protein